MLSTFSSLYRPTPLIVMSQAYGCGLQARHKMYTQQSHRSRPCLTNYRPCLGLRCAAADGVSHSSLSCPWTFVHHVPRRALT